MTISEPKHLPNYQCSDDFIATGKDELSMKQYDHVQVIQKHANGNEMNYEKEHDSN
jgi:hypothetical protein